MINVENITYRYPHGDAPVIHDYSARFLRGEISVIRGKNGCGKTTLTKLIAGILRPSAGRITINDRDAAEMDLFEIGKVIGYVFQNPNRQLFCDTVFNEVAYGLRNLKMSSDEVEQNALYYLNLFDLERYRDTYPGKLSHGEKQRLVLAAVLALGADFLVLDEPATGLDARRRGELGDILAKLKLEQNCGVILVSHSPDFISRQADRELVMP